MTADGTINVALVGLSFGAAFIPIYKLHPRVGRVTLCDIDPAIRDAAGEVFFVDDRRASLDEVLADPTIDAVHLVTPIPLHAEQTLRVLESGKHCACTVPMATTLEGIQSILDAVRRTGKQYMMMETSVYTRHFWYARRMHENGEFGKIQFLRGAHYQDMEFWPQYWLGLPPMHYGTHAVAPLLALAGRQAQSVRCLGSGTMREELVRQYGNPYPIETALFDLGGSLSAEVTRTLFDTAVTYSESFNVYGETASFQWQQVEEEGKPLLVRMGGKNYDANGVLWRGRKVLWERETMPDFAELLPPEIRRFTVKSRFYDETNPQKSFEAGGGHGGAHPYLVDAFVNAVCDNRSPWIDAYRAAQWTAPGICAHESAMRHGCEIAIPQYAP
jgi:predicted dehydrogenase